MFWVIGYWSLSSKQNKLHLKWNQYFQLLIWLSVPKRSGKRTTACVPQQTAQNLVLYRVTLERAPGSSPRISSPKNLIFPGELVCEILLMTNSITDNYHQFTILIICFPTSQYQIGYKLLSIANLNLILNLKEIWKVE